MRIGLIGYGDAGKAIASGLHKENSAVEMFAWAIPSEPSKEPDENGVVITDTLKSLIESSDIIFVLVPGSAAVEVARNAALFLNKEKMYVDLTTSSPHDMNEVWNIIEPTGAKFADGAMMDTVPKYCHKVPTTLCGRDGKEAEEIMKSFNMKPEFLGEEPGKADAVKLLRSLYTKAHLACAFEMLEAAEYYGVADYVMDGLAKTMDSKTFTEGMDGRCAGGVLHATRRAHELLSAAEMLEADGLSAIVSRAGSEKLKEIGELNIKDHLTYGKPKTWQDALRYIKESKR